MNAQKLFDLQCEIVSNDKYRPDHRVAAVLKIQKAIVALQRAEANAEWILMDLQVGDNER